MPLTPEVGRRLHVFNLLERGQLTTAKAAALELTSRQIRRLRGTLRQAGPAGLPHGSRDRPAHNPLAPLALSSCAGVASQCIGMPLLASVTSYLLALPAAPTQFGLDTGIGCALA